MDRHDLRTWNQQRQAHARVGEADNGSGNSVGDYNMDADQAEDRDSNGSGSPADHPMNIRLTISEPQR